MFAFLYVKANFKEICKEISFPSLFRKMLMSAFLLRFKSNYLTNLITTLLKFNCFLCTRVKKQCTFQSSSFTDCCRQHITWSTQTVFCTLSLLAFVKSMMTLWSWMTWKGNQSGCEALSSDNDLWGPIRGVLISRIPVIFWPNIPYPINSGYKYPGN